MHDYQIVQRELPKSRNLYAADAVHLAASIVSRSSILWSEDRHLSKESVLAAALKYGVEIKRLREMF